MVEAGVVSLGLEIAFLLLAIALFSVITLRARAGLRTRSFGFQLAVPVIVWLSTELLATLVAVGMLNMPGTGQEFYLAIHGAHTASMAALVIVLFVRGLRFLR